MLDCFLAAIWNFRRETHIRPPPKSWISAAAGSGIIQIAAHTKQPPGIAKVPTGFALI